MSMSNNENQNENKNVSSNSEDTIDNLTKQQLKEIHNELKSSKHIEGAIYKLEITFDDFEKISKS